MASLHTVTPAIADWSEGLLFFIFSHCLIVSLSHFLIFPFFSFFFIFS